MHVSLVRGLCTHCGRLVVDIPDGTGRVLCPHCTSWCNLAQRKVPLWVLGVLFILLVNLPIMMSR